MGNFSNIFLFALILTSCIRDKEVNVSCISCDRKVEAQLLSEQDEVVTYTLQIERKTEDLKSYLIKDFKSDIKLKTKDGKVRDCIYVHYEETGGILPYEVIIVGFNTGNNKVSELIIKPSVNF